MKVENKISYTTMASPIGPLTIAAAGESVVEIWFGESPRKSTECARDDGAPVLVKARDQLKEYFAGTRTEFDLPLAPRGTAFQQRVWTELAKIPYGVTMSYGELAGRIGNAKASRAVGLANGQNPIAIVAPCHRVIGSNGKLTGYAGGLRTKMALLDFEMAVRATGPAPFPPMKGISPG